MRRGSLNSMDSGISLRCAGIRNRMTAHAIQCYYSDTKRIFIRNSLRHFQYSIQQIYVLFSLDMAKKCLIGSISQIKIK